jgi:hypothetical protein
LFNRRVLGLEIVYPGTQPMRTAQYRSALVWANAVAQVCGRGDVQRVRAHAETSVTGKWDPGQAPGVTINMAAFRNAAATIRREDDMSAAAEDQIQVMYDMFFRGTRDDGRYNRDLGYVVATLGKQISAVQGAISAQEARILAAVAADGTHPVDVAELSDALVVQLGPDLGEALVNELASRLNRNREGNPT